MQTQPEAEERREAAESERDEAEDIRLGEENRREYAEQPREFQENQRHVIAEIRGTLAALRVQAGTPERTEDDQSETKRNG